MEGERDATGRGHGRRPRRRRGTDWVASKEGPGAKTIVAIVAIVVLVVFALQNTDEADIDFLVWDAGVALWVDDRRSPRSSAS